MCLTGGNNNYFLYLSAIAVNIISFTAGGCFSWPSPVLPKLTSTDSTINPLSRPITTSEESWIAAIMNLGAVFGPLVSGVLSEMFGKKKTLLIMGIPMVVSHVLCAFAVNVHFFLVARFLIGIGVGTVFGVVPGYIGDIAEDKNRGVLGCILIICSNTGVLCMYIIGPFLSVRMFSILNIIPMILFYIIFGCFIPESPYDLVKKGCQISAEQSLTKFRNKSKGDVQKELAFITETIEGSKKQINRDYFSLLKSKAIIKGLIISNGLMLFQQFSGICAVLSYTQSIFDSAGSTIPSIYSAMLIGLIQLVFTIVSGQLVERAGRKMLLLLSNVFLIISLIALGLYFFLKTSGKNVDQISWLPVASLILYIAAFNSGMTNMPWVLLSELFPSNVKAIASTITSFFVFFISFLVTMFFPYLNAAIGAAATFWTFAVWLVIGLIFTIFLVPETKGKSISEIQYILEGIQK